MVCLIAYAFHLYGERLFRRWRWVNFAVETTTMAVVIALVFVFLRPISQFIYFQF